MQILKTIREEDLGFDLPIPEVFKERTAARVVCFDKDGKVGFLYSTTHHFRKLPGGGVENGEDILESLKRESREELGCNIENPKEIGIIDEYFNKWEVHQQSLYFTANLIGEKGEPNLIGYEIEHAYKACWDYIDNVIRDFELELGTNYSYGGKHVLTRDLIALKETKKLMNL